MSIWADLAVVLLFTVIGGFFAASEMALVSLRDGQITRLQVSNPKAGDRIAKLHADPNRYLAAVQVGVTLAGFLSAGFGASRIAPSVAPTLESWGLGQTAAGTVSFVAVTILIAYLSLVLSELAPKRVALQRSESVARRVAGVIDGVATVSRPFIWILSISTNGVVRLMGGDPGVGRERMTHEELRGLVAGHAELGADERELIDDVFAAGDRELREIMVPRTEMDYLRADEQVRSAARTIKSRPHSRYPVVGRGPDEVIGFAHVRDILDPDVRGSTVLLRDLVRSVGRFPGSKRVLSTLREMRDGGIHLAIVVDEYGGTDGIVTMEDLVEELVGDIRDESDQPGGRSPLGPSGDLDGLLNLDDVREATGMTLPEGPYETLAGFLIHRLERLPQLDDSIEHDGYILRVRQMDGRRIARIVVEPARGANESHGDPTVGRGSAEAGSAREDGDPAGPGDSP